MIRYQSELKAEVNTVNIDSLHILNIFANETFKTYGMLIIVYQ